MWVRQRGLIWGGVGFYIKLLPSLIWSELPSHNIFKQEAKEAPGWPGRWPTELERCHGLVCSACERGLGVFADHRYESTKRCNGKYTKIAAIIQIQGYTKKMVPLYFAWSGLTYNTVPISDNQFFKMKNDRWTSAWRSEKWRVDVITILKYSPVAWEMGKLVLTWTNGFNL